MALSTQIAKFIHHQYEVIANLPNLILCKNYPLYGVIMLVYLYVHVYAT